MTKLHHESHLMQPQAYFLFSEGALRDGRWLVEGGCGVSHVMLEGMGRGREMEMGDGE